MILNGETGTKRIIELHKTRASEINTQIEADKAELEKLVGTSYLDKLTVLQYNTANVILGCINTTLNITMSVKGYVEEMSNPISGTITINGTGNIYFSYLKAYIDIPMQLEYTASDGTVYVKTITAGIFDTFLGMNSNHYSFALNRVIDHIRFESLGIPFEIKTGTYFYVFK